MKILLLTNMYPSKQAPNYGVFVQRTEKILIEEGHQVVLVQLTKKSSKLKKLVGYIFYVMRFFVKTQVFKPDVIYVHYASQNAKLVLWIKKWKPSIPIILNTHGTDILPQSKAQEKFQPDVHNMMKVLHHVIVPSTYYQQVVKEKYDYQNSITVFPSGGVDTEFFHPNIELGEKFKIKHQIPSEKIIISYISRVDEHKGWQTLLESVSILKLEKPEVYNQIHLIVAGSGSQDMDLNQMSEEFKLTKIITRLPMLTQQEMLEAFNASDAFCFPSVQESLGLVGLEAMATGLPLLASDIPGTKEYINERNAMLFEPNNASQLSNVIEAFVYLNTTERDVRSQNARNTALSFDTKLASKQLTSVFTTKNLL